MCTKRKKMTQEKNFINAFCTESITQSVRITYYYAFCILPNTKNLWFFIVPL